jgi:hypothetical protein
VVVWVEFEFLDSAQDLRGKLDQQKCKNDGINGVNHSEPVIRLDIAN